MELASATRVTSITSPVKVRTKNSVYLVRPLEGSDPQEYQAVKIDNDDEITQPLGLGIVGDFLSLEVGKPMRLGNLITSLVESIENV